MRLWTRGRKGDWNGRFVKSNAFSCRCFEEVCSMDGDANSQIAKSDKGARYYRVCDSCGCSRGHRHYRSGCIQRQGTGIMGRHQRQHGNFVNLWSRLSQSGQSTVEFAVVTAGFLSLSLGLAALWRVFGDGALVEHALAAASHHIQTVFPTTVADIFLY